MEVRKPFSYIRRKIRPLEVRISQYQSSSQAFQCPPSHETASPRGWTQCAPPVRHQGIVREAFTSVSSSVSAEADHSRRAVYASPRACPCPAVCLPRKGRVYLTRAPRPPSRQRAACPHAADPLAELLSQTAYLTITLIPRTTSSWSLFHQQETSRVGQRDRLP